MGKGRVFGQTEPLDQQRVEAGLEGTDRDEAHLRTDRCRSRRREVAPATAQRPSEHAHMSHGPEQTGQVRAPVGDGTVDHLPFSSAGCVKHGAEQPEEQHHRAAPEVTHQREGAVGGRSALPPCHNAPDRAT